MIAAMRRRRDQGLVVAKDLLVIQIEIVIADFRVFVIFSQTVVKRGLSVNTTFRHPQ